MTQDGTGEPPTTIQAVESSFNLIEELEKRGPMGVSEMADIVELPKSTVHVHLATLVNAGYVVKDGQEYRVGLRFLEIGGRERQRLRVYQTAKPEIDKLSRTAGEVANLGIEENGKRVLLYTSEEPGAIFDNAPSGEHTFMHWTSLGKAMLAHFPEERVDHIIQQHGLPQATEYTITTREELQRELAETRQRGYSIEDQDRREGVMAFATAIEDPDGNIIGAVSLSGPRSRFVENTEELVDDVRNAANIITLKYKHY